MKRWLLILLVLIPFATQMRDGYYRVVQPPAGECTLAMIRREWTADRRPLIWKNRDLSEVDQSIQLGSGSSHYRYVGVKTTGDRQRVYAGVNEVGFGIANSVAGNIDDGNPSSSHVTGDVIREALEQCLTLEDFRAHLNFTNNAYSGRTSGSNFFAFDSTGRMSIFEASRYRWTEYPVATNDTFAVRANYALSGDSRWNASYGKYRYYRADRLVRSTFSRGRPDVSSMLQIARDVAPEAWQNGEFPIPFTGRLWSSAPPGYTLLSNTLCNSSTASAQIIQGGKWVDGVWRSPVMWVILGRPVGGVAIPLFPTMTELPPELQEPATRVPPPLFQSALSLANHKGIRGTWVDTRVLGDLFNSWTTLERSMFSYYQSHEASLVTPESVQSLTNWACQEASALYRRIDASVSAVPTVTPISIRSVAPNPFNTTTKINFDLPQAGIVQVLVFDELGRLVDEQQPQQFEAGSHAIEWGGEQQSSGIYFLQLRSNGGVVTRRIVLVE